MDLKWICLIIFVFGYVVLYMFKPNNFCTAIINFCTKSQSYNRLQDEEAEMDDDPCDIVWWTKQFLNSTMEKPLPTLTDDIIIEILVRLPVRSLLQFRSVCKSWKTLISSPQFAKEHLQRSIVGETLSHQRLITSHLVKSYHCEFLSLPMQSLLDDTCTSAKANAVYLKMWCRFEILGCCNGLVCLYDICHMYVRLWNPSTRLKSKKSPTVQNTSGHNVKLYGFGYDCVHDRYKAYIGVMCDYENVTAKVYTFGVNSWTTIEHSSRHWRDTYSPVAGKFVCGTLNWLGTGNVIISFDIRHETHNELFLPDRDNGNYDSCIGLNVIRNYLCACFHEWKSSYMVVWLMKEYGVQHSWTKLVIIPPAEIQLSVLNLFTPLCIWGNGLVLGVDNGRLVLYDFYKQLKFLITRSNARPPMPMLIYYESLVSP